MQILQYVFLTILLINVAEASSRWKMATSSALQKERLSKGEGALEQLSVTPDQLTDEGYLTEAAVTDILKEKGLIPHSILRAEKLLGVKALKTVGIPGGTFTDFLYVFQINERYLGLTHPGGEIEFAASDSDNFKTFLLVKGIKGKEDPSSTEGRNLKIVKNSALGKLPYAKYPDLPKMTFDETVYAYNQFGKEHELSIIHAAKGKALGDVIIEDFATGKISKAELMNVFFSVGKAMGRLHKYIAEEVLLSGDKPFSQRKTYVHGDLHWQNIFVRKLKTGAYEVSLIDTETFARSIRKPKSVKDDIRGFYKTPMFFWQMMGKRLYDALRCSYGAFLKGYASIYPKSEQPNVINTLKSMMLSYHDEFLEAYDNSDYSDEYYTELMNYIANNPDRESEVVARVEERLPDTGCNAF